MKIVFYSLCVLIVSVPLRLSAQRGADTVYMIEPVRESVLHNYLHHHLSHQQEFGMVSLDYHHSQGALHLPVDPYRARRIDFHAVGANRINDLVLSGDFFFNKEFDDSLSYGLKNNLDRWHPFQYFAGKAGTYERQNYRANLTVSYQKHPLLQPFINVEYLYHWTTGSVDPRLESKKFAMRYNPGLMFRFTGFAVAAKAILGKGDERLNLDFKNREYLTNLLHPDRIHYINFGYGYSSIKDTTTTRKYDDYLGGELSFHKAFGGHTLDLVASLEQQRQDNTNDLKSTNVYHTRSTYWEQTAKVSALMHLETGPAIQKIQWSGRLVNGYDGMVDFSPTRSRVNYEVFALENHLHYSFTSFGPAGDPYRRESGRQGGYTLGLDVAHTLIHRQDHAVSVDVENSFVTASPFAQLRVKTAALGEFHAHLQPSYRFSLSDRLGYSANSMNPYIDHVVFGDHRYYQMSILGIRARAEWLTRQITAQYLMGFNLRYAFEQQASGERAPRHSLSMGIALYL